MNELQRKAQMRAVIVEYNKLVGSGMLPLLDDDLNSSRYLWASETVGRLVPTFEVLSDFELNALRDTLNGKPPKVHARLRDLLARTKKNPDAWVNYMMHHAPAFKRYRVANRDYTVETVPLVEAWRMLKQEELRSTGYRKPDWNRLQQRPASSKANPEQKQLWGMEP